MAGTLLSVIFATPLSALLTLAGAASVPVIIHLLNRRRYRVVPWAAMRFLLNAQRKTVRRLQLEQWLLLALRVLILMLIAAAMASVMPWLEPYWQRLFPSGFAPVQSAARTHRILVLDASYSMATREGDTTRFERAKAQAEEWLNRAAPGDGLSVVLLTAPAQTMIPGPVDDPAKVLGELRGVKLPHGGAEIAGGLNLVADLLARSPTKFSQREVVVFTDMQRASWTLPRITGGLAVDSGSKNSLVEAWQQITTRARVVFVDASRQDVDNLAITGLSIGDSLPIAGVNTTISATVQNFGQHERKDVRITFLAGSAGEKGPATEAVALRTLEERTITVAPGTSVAVTIAHTFRELGDVAVQVRLDNDALPLDDVRSLVVRVRETVPVIVVNGKPAVDPLQRGAEWLARALYPFRAGAKVPRYPARPRILSLAEFADAGLGDLSDSDVVFLCDVPQFTPAELARLDTFLRRGGSVVIGLGPNVAKNLDGYNRMLFQEGEGLLPGKLRGVREAKGDGYFTMLPSEESVQLPPLNAFRADNERAALTTPRFRQYIAMEVPARGPARRILSFLPHEADVVDNPPQPSPDQPMVLDVAMAEWPRQRGRVIVFTSTWNVDWNSWPLSPSFPPFVQELFRYAVSGNVKPSTLSGEPLEEFVSVTFAGIEASVLTPDGRTLTVPIVARNEAGLLIVTDSDMSGIYRASMPQGRNDHLFAVNVPIATPMRGSESDLRRIDPTDLQASAPGADVIIVPEVSQIPARAASGRSESTEDGELGEPRGPEVARVLMFLVLALLPLEMWLAYRFGAARAVRGQIEEGIASSMWGRLFRLLMGGLPLAFCLMVLVVLTHEAWGGEFFGFLPEAWRHGLESFFGVPAAAPGEGVRWRLGGLLPFSGDPTTNRWLLFSIAAGLLAVVGLLYAWESRAIAAAWSAVVPMALLRVGLILMTLFVLLPQLRLFFDREGWPDLVIVLDDSRSMGTVDSFTDPAVRERAAQLAKLTGLSEINRLQLAQALLSRGDDWLSHLVAQRQVKVHVYRASTQARLVTAIDTDEQLSSAREAIQALRAEGVASELDQSLVAVLKSFRGGSLTAVVCLTDGVITHDPNGVESGQRDDFQASSRLATKMGVPLFFVGIGDARQPFDLILSDLQVEDAVTVNDRIVFEAKVTAEGASPERRLENVPIILYEKKGDTLIERGRTDVTLDRTGKPQKIKIVHAPSEPGEKVFVLKIPDQPDETELGNNRLERVISVFEEKRLRVLYVEGYPRYDYRVIKSLLERETDRLRGNKTVDLNVFLVDAAPGFAEQDKTALPAFPTKQQLLAYDVVIWGDVDPKSLPNGETHLRDLAEFVREHGGGVILLAGPQSLPRAYADTALAPILPLTLDVAPVNPLPESITESYRPTLTPTGANHPVFRFAPDEAENAAIWTRLQPMFWYASGYRRKLSAEVLATHPDRPAEPPLNPDPATRIGSDEKHPLVLQQFVGAGRVMFLGFEESWRWRFRDDEVHFNQFWGQAIRSLSRNRISRVELRLDRQTAYRKDEPIRVLVRFPDDAPPLAGDAIVKVRVERWPLKGAENTQPEMQTLQLARRDGTRGSYETILTRTPEGQYRFTLLSPDIPSGKPYAEARVLPPPGEMDRLMMNQEVMERAANESHGRFMTLADVDGLFDALPPGQRVALDQPCPPWSIWNHPAIFGLLLAMFAAEWMFRKQRSLV